MENFDRNMRIAYDVFVKGLNKTEAGKRQDVSPRTVGRALQQVVWHYNTSHQCLLDILKTYFGDLDDSSSDDYSDDDVYDDSDDYSSDDYSDDDTEPYNAPSRYDVVASESSITITRTHVVHGREMITVTPSHARWESISDVVWDGKGSQESLQKAFTMASLKDQIESLEVGDIKVDVVNNVITYKGRPIPVELHGRIIEAGQQNDKDTMENLCHFADKLMKNPSYRAVQELYRFLKAADIEIVEDGMVKCFKRVRSDYKDVYTGTFDNSPGVTVEVPRNLVDEDSERTCSHGLHVCSKHYLPHYAQGSRILSVLVDPADFVAVPKDYNDSKARVSRYYVEADITSKMVI